MAFAPNEQNVGLSDSSPYATYSKFQLLAILSFKDVEIKDLNAATNALVTQVHQMQSLLQQLSEENAQQLANDREELQQQFDRLVVDHQSRERAAAAASAEASIAALKAEFAAWRRSSNTELEQVKIQYTNLLEENKKLQQQLALSRQSLMASESHTKRLEQQVQLGSTATDTALAIAQAEKREMQRVLEDERRKNTELAKQLDATVIQLQRGQLPQWNNGGSYRNPRTTPSVIEQVPIEADVSSPIAPKHFLYLGLQVEIVPPLLSSEGNTTSDTTRLIPVPSSTFPSSSSQQPMQASSSSPRRSSSSSSPVADSDAILSRLIANYNNRTDVPYLQVTDAIEPAATGGLVHIGDWLLSATVSKTYLFEDENDSVGGYQNTTSRAANNALTTYEQLVNELSLYSRVELTVARRSGNTLAVKTLRPFCPQVAEYY